MSVYSSSAVIDPALQDIPHPKPAGMKRKARQAVAPPPPTRVTRRQAAAAALPPPPIDPPSSASSSHALDEPSRGEEENLISYEWARENTKRSRRRSPSAHQPRSRASPAPVSGHQPPLPPPNHKVAPSSSSSRPRTPQESHTPGWAGSVQHSTHNSPSGGPAAGIDNLAAAAAAYQSIPTLPPPQPRYPYPYGLTPFRYECLTPHLPPPPPGDPANPAFRRFDPTHGSTVEHQQQHHHPSQHHGYHAHIPAGSHSYPQSRLSSVALSERSHEQRLPERTEHHTLAALLSATEAASGSAPSSRPRTPELLRR